MRIAIIGGGAAGMMAAATINETAPDVDVFLLEKNAGLGKKVLISGGGRCNVTTGIEDVKMVLTKYPRGARFLTSAMHHFSPVAVREWFEAHGVPLKCEEDLRVFPVSDKGSDVVGVFEKIFARHKTNLLTNYSVNEVKRVGEQFEIRAEGREPLVVDRLILALGGQAYRHTGSTGDGYSFAESFGHHVTALAPSLHSFILAEKWARQLAGLSLEIVSITAPDAPKPHSFTGPILFTHTGISGPAVFALSSLIAFYAFSPNKPLKLQVDLLPGVPRGEVQTNLEQAMKASPRKSFKNTIHQFIPQVLAEIFCEELAIDVERKNAEVSKSEIERAVTWLKQLPLHATLRGAGSEFVTAGGVELVEVDPRTMESRISPGLYFAGEILNIDGFTGGFNLQASWATGRLAGEHSCS